MPAPKAVLAIALAVALAGQPRAGQADRLHTPECLDARSVLDTVIDEPAQERRNHPERLAQARKLVADTCLGRASGNAQRTGAPEPPIAVPAPLPTEPPRSPPARPPAPAALPAPPAPRPPVITACDPAGCWDSNGQRLNNMGPLLLGRRGICVPQAGQANCP